MHSAKLITRPRLSRCRGTGLTCTGIAWTFFSGESSRAFREGLPFDEAAWARGRGWAIWKAMKVLVGALEDDPEDAAFTTRVIEAILADYVAAA
jgi:hypothetical protein